MVQNRCFMLALVLSLDVCLNEGDDSRNKCLHWCATIVILYWDHSEFSGPFRRQWMTWAERAMGNMSIARTGEDKRSSETVRAGEHARVGEGQYVTRETM
jgi:hypothetical protein